MMTIGPYPLALERGSCTREFTTPWVSGRAGGVGECPKVADNRAAQYWFRSSCIRTVTMVTEAEGLEKERAFWVWNGRQCHHDITITSPLVHMLGETVSGLNSPQTLKLYCNAINYIRATKMTLHIGIRAHCSTLAYRLLCSISGTRDEYINSPQSGVCLLE